MELPTERITSKQNTLLKLTASLSERKYREREGLFRFDGKKLWIEALDADLPLSAVLLRESSAPALLAAAGDRKLPKDARAVLLPDDLFDHLSEEKSPEGVICISKRLDKFHKFIIIDGRDLTRETLREGRSLLVESVRDPGNLGTIIRTARAFGVENLVLSSDCADLYHSRTVRAAMGTLFRQYVVVTENLAAVADLLAERGHVYAAALDDTAARLGTFAFGKNDAVIVGNEGHGISPELLCHATEKVFIPMEAGVESLNAGIAASVLLWELYRNG